LEQKWRHGDKQYHQEAQLTAILDFIDKNFGILVVGLIVAGITALSVAHNNRLNRAAIARAAFRAAVMTELGSVYPVPNPWPDNIAGFLKSRFSALQAAVVAFRPVVKEAVAFDAAWLNFYCAYPTKMQEQCYHHYGTAHDPMTGTQEMAQKKALATFRANVERLLSFAEDA
jgi:hypothetical protein